MKKSIILTAMFAMVATVAFADNDYDDDIYYNPKAQKSVKTTKTSQTILPTVPIWMLIPITVAASIMNRRSTQ